MRERQRSRHARVALNDVGVVPDDCLTSSDIPVEHGVGRQCCDGSRLKREQSSISCGPLEVLRYSEFALEAEDQVRYFTELVGSERYLARPDIVERDLMYATFRVRDDRGHLVCHRNVVFARAAVHDEMVTIQLAAYDSFALAPNALHNECVTISGSQRVP